MISLLEIATNINEADVDDDKIIKYKDKEGESQEMTAGAAKKQPDDHPAKAAYNKMSVDGGDDSEKDSGGKLGGDDFERDAFDASDEPDTGNIPSTGFDAGRDAGRQADMDGESGDDEKNESEKENEKTSILFIL